MHLFSRIFFLSVILTGLLALTACPSQTTISKINQNPARYHGKEIGIVGTVTDSYGALGTGVYELDDGTGRIWVATTRGVPAKGTRVGPPVASRPAPVLAVAITGWFCRKNIGRPGTIDAQLLRINCRNQWTA